MKKHLSEQDKDEVAVMVAGFVGCIVFLVHSLNGIYSSLDLYVMLGGVGCFLIVPFIIIFLRRRFVYAK